MKKNILYGLLSISIIVLAILFSSFLINSKPEPKTSEKKHNVMYVKSEKVTLKEIKTNKSYRGRVSAFDEISLSAEVSGKIMQGDIRFKSGERFKKGDIIIKIYNEDVKASIKSGISSFLQTLAVILPDINVDFYSEYEKWNSFFNAIDPENPLPKLPQINSDKEKVFLASNNVLSAYYNLVQKEINLSKYTIKAPFDGILKSVNKEIGAIANSSVELASIIRSNKLEIIVPVFPDDVQWIKKGDNVEISGNNGLQQFATVSRISGFVDQESQSINVFLTYHANNKENLYEGEYVDAEFNGTKVRGFSIPREAIVNENSVYELKNGKLTAVTVEIVRQLNDEVIISGIEENSVIVTESLSSINPTVEYKAR